VGFFKLNRQVPTLAAPEQRATSILIEKEAHRLTLLRNDAMLKTYTIALGSNPVGHKQQEGDRRTPEGDYKIDFKNQRSRFHLALRISYPDAKDSDSAQQRWRAARQRYHDSRIAERPRLAWRKASRLDRWLRGGDEC
jgi:murein L,D-transpeptidase YafK